MSYTFIYCILPRVHVVAHVHLSKKNMFFADVFSSLFPTVLGFPCYKCHPHWPLSHGSNLVSCGQSSQQVGDKLWAHKMKRQKKKGGCFTQDARHGMPIKGQLYRFKRMLWLRDFKQTSKVTRISSSHVDDGPVEIAMEDFQLCKRVKQWKFSVLQFLVWGGGWNVPSVVIFRQSTLIVEQ